MEWEQQNRGVINSAVSEEGVKSKWGGGGGGQEKQQLALELDHKEENVTGLRKGEHCM